MAEGRTLNGVQTPVDAQPKLHVVPALHRLGAGVLVVLAHRADGGLLLRWLLDALHALAVDALQPAQHEIPP